MLRRFLRTTTDCCSPTKTPQKYCRICFEKDFEGSRLIAPCKCRGSSRYIHVHCLETWQETSIENNTPHKATTCPVCLSEYDYPNRFYLFYRRMAHFMKSMWTILSILWLTFAVTPMKMIVHALLVIVTVPFGQLSMGDMALAWVGCDFPPQLALIRNGQRLSIPALRRGVLLVASREIPNTSLFCRVVILVLEHSKSLGSRGIIINVDREDSTAALGDVKIGAGGPMENDVFTILHNCLASKQYSKPISIEHEIFAAENENAFLTVQFMLRMKMFMQQPSQDNAAEQYPDRSFQTSSGTSRQHPNNVASSSSLDTYNEDDDLDSIFETESTLSTSSSRRSFYIRAFTSLLGRLSQRVRQSIAVNTAALSAAAAARSSVSVFGRPTPQRGALPEIASRSFPGRTYPTVHPLAAGGGQRNLLATSVSAVTSPFLPPQHISSDSGGGTLRSVLRNPNYRGISQEERRSRGGGAGVSGGVDNQILGVGHGARLRAMDMINSIQAAERLTPSSPLTHLASVAATNDSVSDGNFPRATPSISPFRALDGTRSSDNTPLPIEGASDQQHQGTHKQIHVRFVRGNCLWLPGQLAGEVWARDWHILPVRPEYLFLTTGSNSNRSSRDSLWQDLIEAAESYSDAVLVPLQEQQEALHQASMHRSSTASFASY